MTRARIIWLLVVLFYSGMGPGAAEVYTWIDAGGLVHITDRPPPPGVRVAAVDKDQRPLIEKGLPEVTPTDAGAAAPEQGAQYAAAWQTLQDLGDRLEAAKSVYEDAATAVLDEQAKYTYSAQRRTAPRQTVADLEEKAKAAFTTYRQLLDAYRQAEAAAREAGQHTRGAIGSIGEKGRP